MVKKITITTTPYSNHELVKYIAVWTNNDVPTISDPHKRLEDVFSDVFRNFDPNDKFEILFKNNANNVYGFDFIEYLSATNPQKNPNNQ